MKANGYILALLLMLLFGCGGDEDSPTGPGGNGDRTALSITSEPTGADIFIDDGGTGEKTPATIDVTQGSHMVKLQLCDYEDWDNTYYVNEGETVDAQATLDLTFFVFDDFESEIISVLWSTSHVFSLSDGTSYDGSRSIHFQHNANAGEQGIILELRDRYDLPECLTPQVFFYYKFEVTEGSATARIEFSSSSVIAVALNPTSQWRRVDVPASQLESLTGSCRISFRYTSGVWGDSYWHFYLDDFSMSAQ